jgi:hypothetical protein
VPESGFYRDPLERHFARFYTGEGWAYRVRDADEKEWTFFDADLNDEFLKWLEAPSDSELIEAITIEAPKPQTVASQLVNETRAESLIAEFASKIDPPVPTAEGWIQGFNSQVRLNGDSIEISSFATKSRSALFLSSIQDVANAGTRIIPLRTIQAVHFHPASRGAMGTIQFTVPGSLTGQARNNSGKVLSLLGADLRVQSHENSISFELSQQSDFEAFHTEIVERIGNLELSGPKTSNELSDHISQLRDLKLLLDDGILTQDEFDSAKQAILKKL